VWLGVAVVALIVAGPACAQTAGSDATWPDLAELGKIEVTTVSKRPQPAWIAAAALAVVTGEDICRSGADSLPEALRLAPGLDVAQIDARNWAVSARGFNAQLSNKLLVLIDGRSVYTPLFGGVFWDSQHTVLADVDRIEVVRGPGAALWGANAMNGVINIVTKSARDTVGGYAEAIAGTDHSGATVRWGAAPEANWAWRLSAQVDDYAATDSLTFGGPAGDAWHRTYAGFRGEFTPATDRTLTVQVNATVLNGDYTQYLAGRAVPGFETYDRTTGIRADTLDGQVRWEQRRADGGSDLVQVWAEHTGRRSALYDERRNTLALDWQQSRLGVRHSLTWGFGYQRSWDRIADYPMVRVDSPGFTNNLFSAFVQDEWAIAPDRFALVGGARLEHNSFTGFEVQPSLRAVWRPDPAQTFWVGISRAVRSPTRVEDDAIIDVEALPAGALGEGTPPALIEWHGSRDFRSEVLIAWEVGWRTQLSPQLTLDVTTFLHDYSHLQDLLPAGSPALETTEQGPVLVVPWSYTNTLGGRSYGLEVAATWQPSSRLRLAAGYTFDRVTEDGPAGGLDEAYFENSTPLHSGFVRAGLVLARGWELGAELRAASDLPAVTVPGYASIGLRLAWRPRPGFEIEVSGQNLNDPSHPEFRDGTATQIAGIRRSLHLRTTWHF